MTLGAILLEIKKHRDCGYLLGNDTFNCLLEVISDSW